MSMTSHPLPAAGGIWVEVRTSALRIRDDYRRRWSAATPRTRTRVQLAALLGSVVVAYNYSLITLLQTVSLDTPLAYVSLVPAIALALAAVHSNPRRAEPPIHDRQVDYIVGVPLIAAALAVNLALPAHLSVMFWVWRLDLMTLPVFVAGAVAIIFGTRMLWRQKFAIAYLILAWPLPYSTVLGRLLNSFTDLTLLGLRAAIRILPVGRPTSLADGSVFEVLHHGISFPVSVVTACSGVNGMVGFLLVGSAFAAVVRGPLVRKCLWLAGGLVLLWLINLGRLLFIFWAGHEWGEHIALGILHPFVGVLTFGLGVVVMVVLIRPLGMRLEVGGYSLGMPARRPTGPIPVPSLYPEVPKAPAVPRAYAAMALVLVAALALGVANVGLRPYNLVADATGAPRLVAYTSQPAVPAGWGQELYSTFGWTTPLFGFGSTWNRYRLYPVKGKAGDLQVPTVVTADVIQASNAGVFSTYGIESCYQFHGYRLRDVNQVNLGGGITSQAMSFTTGQGASWSIVYWIIPVKGAGGSTRYERTVLFVQNSGAGVVPVSGADASGIPNVSGQLRTADPSDAALIRNQAFLVAFARQLVEVQAHHVLAATGTSE